MLFFGIIAIYYLLIGQIPTGIIFIVTGFICELICMKNGYHKPVQVILLTDNTNSIKSVQHRQRFISQRGQVFTDKTVDLLVVLDGQYLFHDAPPDIDVCCNQL